MVSEAPHYNEDTGELVWVDIIAKSVNILNVTTHANRCFRFSEFVGAAIPCQNNRECVAVMTGRSVILLNTQTG